MWDEFRYLSKPDLEQVSNFGMSKFKNSFELIRMSILKKDKQQYVTYHEFLYK